MKWIGAHVSANGGVENAPLMAAELKATAFALFTKNQRQWEAKPLETKNIDMFKKNLHDKGYTPEQVLPHASYLVNLGNPDQDKRKHSIESFAKEMHRCRDLGLLYLNVHPGTGLGELDDETCCATVANSINQVLDKSTQVTVVIENTAGQGSWVGYRFEHLARIIEMVDDKTRIGVCFDTAHAFAAGYDLRTTLGYNKIFESFDKIVGLKYLLGMHINDSKANLGSRVDRHENIGKGLLGIEPFRTIINDPRLDRIPLILETIDEDLWAQEIELLQNFASVK